MRQNTLFLEIMVHQIHVMITILVKHRAQELVMYLLEIYFPVTAMLLMYTLHQALECVRQPYENLFH